MYVCMYTILISWHYCTPTINTTSSSVITIVVVVKMFKKRKLYNTPQIHS